MSKYLYLERENQQLKEKILQGRKRERLKADIRGESYEKYLISLKARLEAEKRKPRKKKELPYRKLPSYPVSNPQSPVIQNR